MEDRQRRNRRQFTAEFKRDAVQLVRTTGRPIAEIARELGIYDSTLGSWVRQDRINRGEQDGLSTDDRARLRELEGENTKLRMERDCSNEPSPSGSRNSRHREALPLRRCPEGRRVCGSRCLPGGRGDPLGLLRLAATTAQGPADRHWEEAELVSEIGRIHARSRGTYGAPRIHAELRRRGWTVNHKRVERLMRAHGIVGYRPRRRRSLTKQDTPPRPPRICWGGCST